MVQAASSRDLQNSPVAIVDDDAILREVLEEMLRDAGFSAATFESPRQFLSCSELGEFRLLITDIRMPEMDGLELQAAVAQLGLTLPIIVLSGHADVALAVRAMKAGAADFIEKPPTKDVVIESAWRALELGEQSRKKAVMIQEVERRIAELTARERQVLDMIVAGQPNKIIAYELGLSARTIEIHRAKLMEKMRARRLSDLVRFALMAGVGSSIHA